MKQIKCKYCKSNKTIKQGLRKNMFNDVQKYHCKNCDRFFSINNNFRMRYPQKVRELALRLNKEGKSLRQISRQLIEDTHVKVSHTNIMNWVKVKEFDNIQKALKKIRKLR